MRTCEHGCNGCDRCTDYDETTDEDRNREYLRQRPAYEMSLWQDWILTICKRRELAPPSGYEWDVLMANFHHGKMPVTSVEELVELRKQTSTTPTSRNLA